MNRNDINIGLFKYNPFDPETAKKLEEQYEEFKPSFNINKEEATCYLILLNDLNTPLRERVPDFIERKKECANLAGFKKNKDGTFAQKYEDIILGNNDNYNSAEAVFIKSFGSVEYLSLRMHLNIMASEYINSTKLNKSQDFKSTLQNIETLEKKITQLTDVLFGGAEVVNMRTALYRQVEKDFIHPTPERIAKCKNKEELDKVIDVDPYHFKNGKVRKGMIPKPVKPKPEIIRYLGNV